MSEAVDYAEVRAFLEAQGYSIDKDEQGWVVANYESDDFHRPQISEKLAYLTGLRHFLCHWLGVRWSKGAFHAIDYAREEKGHDYGFEPDEWQTIEKARAYYEAISE
jgi:hypothetical protein